MTAIDKENKLSRLLRRGHKVRLGDTIKTGPKSMAQLVFLDRSMLYIKANSTIELEEFHWNEKQRKDGMVTKIVKGSVRALTGLIGKRNPESVKFKSPVGTIGIRGTALEISEAPNGDAYVVLVDFGKVVLTNESGELVVGAEKSATSSGLKQSPVETEYLRPENDSKNVAECLVNAKTEKDHNRCKSLFKTLALEELLFMTAMETQVPGFTAQNLMTTIRRVTVGMPVSDSAILLTTSSQVYPDSTPEILATAVKSKIDISIALESVIRGLDKPAPETLNKVIVTAIGLGLTHEDAMKVLEEVKNQGVCR